MSGSFEVATPDDVLDDELQAQTRVLFEDTCRWIMTLGLHDGVCKVPKSTEESPFTWVNGNLARVLIAGYKIYDEPAYLDEALRWFDLLASRQQQTTTSTGLEAGFWGDRTGPGNLYLADSGTAVSAMALGYRLAASDRQERYLTAMTRFVRFLQYGSLADPQGEDRSATSTWIITTGTDKGALGCGYYRGSLSTAPYIVSTAVTAVEFLSLFQSISPDPDLAAVPGAGVRWLLDHQLPTGEFPYIIAGKTLDPNAWPLDTMTYVCEGLIVAYLYHQDPGLRHDIADGLKASVEWLLRTQNENGCWGSMRSADQQRSPGCVNLLTWYHRTVDPDPRIADAVRRYCRFLLDPSNQDVYGFKRLLRTTGFVGLVLGNLIRPEVIFA